MIWQKKLKIKDFSIISNNCWGGNIYQYLNLEYKSPTIGLMIFPDDYVKFCKHIDFYLEQELRFVELKNSKKASRFQKDQGFPVGYLYDIEIYFMHYKTEAEAREKWNRRKLRINKKCMIFKMSERDGATLDDVEEFLKLPYKNKIVFTQNKYNSDNTVLIPELKTIDAIGSSEVGITLKHFNVIKYLNGLLE